MTKPSRPARPDGAPRSAGPGHRHGLVIGKFYPPHLGHHRLIRTAAAQVGRLTVVVMASARETIALSDRVRWLRAEHGDDARICVTGIPCDAPLDTSDTRVWDAQVACMKAAVAQAYSTYPWVGPGPAPTVDAVWCGDDYGAELAARFDAALVPIGRDGLSGTVVRSDVARHWDDLAVGTRAGLALRAVFVGAESTGTTTVSESVARRYRERGGIWARTEWVAEYGRDYTEIKWSRLREASRAAGVPEPELIDINWDETDFDAVAREQTRREDAAAQRGSPLLVCDTNAFATWIWKRRYLGMDAAGVRPDWAIEPELPSAAIYFVTDHREVPWQDDGLREGELAVRAAMTQWFVEALTEAGYSWVLLTGSLADRVRLAERTLDGLLDHHLAFGEPLHGPGFE